MAHVLGARQNDQVRGRNRLPRPDKPEIHPRVQAQRVKIGVVADAGEHRGDDLQGVPLRFHVRVRGNTVLCVQVEAVQVRQHPQHRFSRPLFQPCQARLQQGDVAAELVDDKPGNPLPLALAEQVQRPDQVGEHAAPVDIGDEDDRAVGLLGETHVGDIPVAQVYLRRTAGAFRHNIVVTVLQAAVGFHDGAQQGGFSFVVRQRIQGRINLAVHDHLGADIRIRF